MTHTFTKRAVLGALLSTPFVNLAQAATRDFRLDTSRSEVRFTYYLEGSPGHCSIDVSDAQFRVDLADLGRSSVRVALNPRTIRAGFLPATEALKGAKLLDARRFPSISFESQSIQPSGAGGAISGDLNIKGTSRRENFRAQFINAVPTPDATSFGIQMSGMVDRHAYGVSGFSSFVGPRVDFRIRAYLSAV
ncbi:YceI family protein [Pseudooctadecabacter jejudonensis]|uniref:Lipid/polyisoprenoid-binding YceI-like domain-containing protein n=1 Tax=Pseudooctadecabacter jejudonensis TaxID=1391910 RepID=A0A1Y5RAX3_9RHOB|nr:YceI family protein [Pseudooctadecabacter jejudonensis]SLN12048.1 hypothetical protein PSJ8397_00136 [Pseudooctadecabacter jejudonensis]